MHIKGSNYFVDLGMGMCMSIYISLVKRIPTSQLEKDHTYLLDIRKAKMKVVESCR